MPACPTYNPTYLHEGAMPCTYDVVGFVLQVPLIEPCRNFVTIITITGNPVWGNNLKLYHWHHLRFRVTEVLQVTSV